MTPKLSPPQFTVLAALRGMRPGPSKECVRLVFVEGLSLADATHQTGLTRQAAGQALKRAKHTLQLARAVCGLSVITGEPR
jgi:DNA-directed RNA polymerase specialized sigma24 family protein